MNNKFVLSYSGGKDCMLALYRKIQEGCIPVALLTTVKKSDCETWTHGLSYDLLEQVSKSLEIPVIYAECDVSEYEIKFEEKLKVAKEMGATSVVYGDIDIELHKQWGIDRAINTGLNYEFPLWKENREKLVHEAIDNGFKAIIKKVNLDYMNEDFLGKTLTKELVEKIKSTGSDPCGENGEYHTFVVDGPIFNYRIEVKQDDFKSQNSYRFSIK
ncbi:diphthine--ammonia ligase [Terrisporobacter glycolicus]|uniref:Diphthamide synthase domain-containing protein n=1 Tax=Terrisporobacter glycolicus ATCC 14880 = DSM 1288 TaxID=1121315 RepID=A0ABZ2ERD0_9FIRM|nr:diphthine--ammonia ligase [Terrisporobacter glycolicus]